MFAGIARVPLKLGGVKIPSFLTPSTISRQAARSSGVAPHTSSTLKRCGLSGSMPAVNGCVGDASSPGTSLGGTGRSSIGKTGSPFSRLRTNSMPVLVAWITAGIRRPFREMVTSAGGEALS